MLVVESREEETWFLTIRLLSTAESDPLQDPPATEAWGNWPDRLTSVVGSWVVQGWFALLYVDWNVFWMGALFLKITYGFQHLKS